MDAGGVRSRTDSRGHAVFSDPVWGIRAGLITLRTYYVRHGLKTIRQILSRWAPVTDTVGSRPGNLANDPGEYSRFVARQTNDADLQGVMPPTANPYPAIDRFGRLLKARWLTTGATPAVRAQVNYTYDRASRRTRRMVPNAPSPNKETETYAYDGLSQVTLRKRGAAVYDGSNFIGITTQRQEEFNYDTLGNWAGYSVYGPDANTFPPPNPPINILFGQGRSHNVANQITSFNNTTQQVTHDAAGNCTQSAPVQNSGTIDWSASHVYKWDAWSRLVLITHSGTGAEIARHAYDGLTAGFAQEARTEEGHPLTGIRRWGAVVSKGRNGCLEAMIWTAGVEVPNNIVSFPPFAAGAREAADEMWKAYLDTLASKIIKHCGGGGQGGTARITDFRSSKATRHPWLPR